MLTNSGQLFAKKLAGILEDSLAVFHKLFNMY
jgi:hypothetical protein